MSWARPIHLKSPAELQIMRQAGRINAEVLAATKELLKPGVSTADLNAAANIAARAFVNRPMVAVPRQLRLALA